MHHPARRLSTSEELEYSVVNSYENTTVFTKYSVIKESELACITRKDLCSSSVQ